MIPKDELPVVALVTAYNEETTIGAVLDALVAAPSVTRIHVIDDASTDGTRAAALAKGVEVKTLPTKLPVGEAIMAHLDAVTDECVLLWCDADLVGLTPQHVEAIVVRYREGDVVQSLSSRGVPQKWPSWLRRSAIRRFWAWYFGPLSGERAILRSDFVAAITVARGLGWSEMMRGYGIVMFLNWWAKTYGGGGAVTYFDDLSQRMKFEKWGRGAWLASVSQWVQFCVVWLKIRACAPFIRRAARRLKTSG